MTEPTCPARWRPVLLGLALAGACWLGPNEASAGVLGPNFDKAFFPDTIAPDSTSTLRFTIENTGPTGITDLAFVDFLPAGTLIAGAPGLFTDCVNGLVVAPAGGSSISFAEGRLSAFSTCTIEVNVTGSTPGLYTNVSGDLTSSAGNSGPATAELTVNALRPAFTKFFSPSTVNLGERSRLTFTIDATLIATNTFNLNFTDILPDGMTLAAPTNFSSDCVGVPSAIPETDTIQLFGGFLMPGAQCSLAVDVVAHSIGQLENVSRELQSTAGNSGFAAASLEVLGHDVNLSKRFTPNPALPGEIVDLEFTLQNTDRALPAQDLSFSDDLGAMLPGAVAVGLPLVDPCGPGSTVTGAAVIALNGASLQADASCTFSVPVQLPAAVPAGSYPNVTSALTGTVGGAPIVTPAARSTLFVNETPILTKVFLDNPIGAGDITRMEFTLTNPSASSTATDVGFTDNLTRFMTEVGIAAVPPVGFCIGTGFATAFTDFGDLLLGVQSITLPPGASCTFIVELEVGPGTPAGSYLNTTSEVSATMDGETRTGRTASAVLEVATAPRLTLSFTDDPVLAGGTATLEYTLTYPEEAPSAVQDVAFSHDLTATLTGLAATGLPLADVCGPGSQLAGTTTLILTGGSLTPGTNCTFSLSVQVPAGATPGSYPSTTSEPSGLVGPAPFLDVLGVPASDTLQVGGLEFTKTFIDDPVFPGAPVTLRYTLSNVGTGDFTGGVFTDNFPSALTGLAVSGPLPVEPCGVGSTLIGTTTLIAANLNLTAGTSCSFDVPLQVPAAASAGQYASASSTLTGTYGGNATALPAAADLLEVLGLSVPELAKTFIDDPVAPGDTVTLEFTLSNPDPALPMTSLTFTDDLNATLAGLTAVGLAQPDVCGAGSLFSGVSDLTLIGGTLAAGASCTFSVTLQVPAGTTPGSYPNTTSVPQALIAGQSVSGTPASDTLQIVVAELVKSFANPGVTGSTTTLSFTLSNPGATPLSALAFSDDLDAALPGLIATGLPLADVCGPGSLLAGTSVLSLSDASLAAGASCSFDVTVQIPAAALPGVYTNTTSEVTASGLPVGAPAVADLQVIGIPALDITPTTVDLGAVRVGTPSAPQVATLNSTGNDVLTVSGIAAASGQFARVGGTCAMPPFTLAAGGSCTISYVFTPSATGPASQNLQVTSDDPASPDFIQLAGTGIESALQITPAPVDFGDVRVGTTSASASATLSNPGTASLNVTALDVAALPFASVGGSCGPAPFSIATGASCTLDFSFAPTATGPAQADLAVDSDAPTSPDVLSLRGNGVEPELLLTPATIDFGNVGTDTVSPPATTTVSNPGTADLTISAIDAPTLPFAAAAGSCGPTPIVLAPGSTCTLGYTFAPTMTGPAQLDLAVTSDAPGSPDTLGLVGNGEPPNLSLGATLVDFGPVPIGFPAERSLLLTSSAAGTLVIDSLGAPAAPFEAETGDCGPLPITLTSGQSCSLLLRFTPGSINSFTASFDIGSNDPDGPQTVELRGLGQPLAVPALDRYGLVLLALMLGVIGARRRMRPTR